MLAPATKNSCTSILFTSFVRVGIGSVERVIDDWHPAAIGMEPHFSIRLLAETVERMSATVREDSLASVLMEWLGSTYKDRRFNSTEALHARTADKTHPLNMPILPSHANRPIAPTSTRRIHEPAALRIIDAPEIARATGDTLPCLQQRTRRDSRRVGHPRQFLQRLDRFRRAEEVDVGDGGAVDAVEGGALGVHFGLVQFARAGEGREPGLDVVGGQAGRVHDAPVHDVRAVDAVGVDVHEGDVVFWSVGELRERSERVAVGSADGLLGDVSEVLGSGKRGGVLTIGVASIKDARQAPRRSVD